MRLSWVDKDSGEAIELRFDVVSKESVDSVLNITKHPVESGADIVDHAHPEPEKISIEGYVSNTPLPSNPGVFFSEVVVQQSSLTPLLVPLDTGNAEKLPVNPPQQIPLDMSNAGKADLALSLNTVVNVIGAGIASLLGKGPPTAYQGFSGLGRQSIPNGVLAFKAVDGFENRARAMYTALKSAQSKRARITVDVMLVSLDNMLIGKLGAVRMSKDGNGATFDLDLERVRIVSSETVDAPIAAESRGAKPVSKGASHGKEDDEAEAARKRGIAYNLGLGAKAPGIGSIFK